MPRADLSVAGRVVRGDGEPRRGQVLISKGRIVEILSGEPTGEEATRGIDVASAYVLPGAIDCHVHSGSHPGEGITALTRSAAAGGVTTVVDMPYDAEAPVVDPEVFAAKSDRVAREAVVDVALLGTVRPGTGAEDVAPLVAAGAVGFKLSLFCTDARRFPRIHDGQFLEVLEAIRESGSVACVHAENEEIIKPLIEQARRLPASSPLAHCLSRPPVSETQAVLTALEYARSTGARLHLCHLSLPRSVELAGRFRSESTAVSVETCPHYLWFSEDDMERLGGRLKINPPVRSRPSMEGLWEQIAGGSIDLVASDHAPWPLSHKTHPDIFDNHSGAPGVETLLPLLATGLFARGGAPGDLARLVSATPAQLFGLPGKGALEIGMDGDVVAFDPTSSYAIDEQDLHSNALWSPYDKMTMGGRVVLTVSRGEVVWDGATVLGSPGHGRLVKPGHGGAVGG